MVFTAQFRQPTTAQEVTDVMKEAVIGGQVPVVDVDVNSIINNGKCNCHTFSKECVPKNNFLISQPKHMLWVLKRTVSMRWFFSLVHLHSLIYSNPCFSLPAKMISVLAS